MNSIERMKMIKAMEMIARCVNNENIFDLWLELGVPDGTYEYGDLDVSKDSIDGFYCGGEGWNQQDADRNFSYLMTVFLDLMYDARDSGGLYCDGVIS